MVFFYGVLRLLLAAGCTVVVIRLLGPLAGRHGWLDRPLGRKNHATATPFIGGVAILFTVLLMLPFAPLDNDTLIAFCAGALLLLAVGLHDDLRALSWLPKLLAQIAAAAFMVYLGNLRSVSIGPLADAGSVALGQASAAYTIFITVGIINALNMADGSDGAAGCATLSSLLLLALACALTDNTPLLGRILIFIGAVCGFLVMNLRHRWLTQAQVFLGNSGSAIVGFALAWMIVRISQTAGDPVATMFAPWFVALPVLDAIVLALRRLWRRRSPFIGDREHLHHLLLDAGYAPTTVALTLGGVSLLLGIAGIGLAAAHASALAQISAFILLAGLVLLLSADRTRTLRWLSRGSRRAAEAAIAVEQSVQDAANPRR